MTLPSTLSDQDELMQRIARDLIDSYDEELELEIEDRNMDELESGQAADKAARRAYFKELFGGRNLAQWPTAHWLAPQEESYSWKVSQ